MSTSLDRTRVTTVRVGLVPSFLLLVVGTLSLGLLSGGCATSLVARMPDVDGYEERIIFDTLSQGPTGPGSVEILTAVGERVPAAAVADGAIADAEIRDAEIRGAEVAESGVGETEVRLTAEAFNAALPKAGEPGASPSVRRRAQAAADALRDGTPGGTAQGAADDTPPAGAPPVEGPGDAPLEDDVRETRPPTTDDLGAPPAGAPTVRDPWQPTGTPAPRPPAADTTASKGASTPTVLPGTGTGTGPGALRIKTPRPRDVMDWRPLPDDVGEEVRKAHGQGATGSDWKPLSESLPAGTTELEGPAQPAAPEQPAAPAQPEEGCPVPSAGGMPPVPPPPVWDPRKDLTVLVGPDGRPIATSRQGPRPSDESADGETATGSPDDSSGATPGVKSGATSEEDFWVTGGESKPRPPAGRVPEDNTVPPPAGSPDGGLGAPPAGAPDARPAEPTPPAGDTAGADDPWLPGAGSTTPGPTPGTTTPGTTTPGTTTPGTTPRPGPAPTVPEPKPDPSAEDPWLPGGGDTTPAPATPGTTPGGAPAAQPGAAEDPWLPGGEGVPPAKGDTAPGQPTPGQPTPGEAPPAGGEVDPWEDAGAASMPRPEAPAPGVGRKPTGSTPKDPGADGGYVGKTVAARALEHTTRLMDDPGTRSIAGYPASIVPADPAGQALTPGRQPCVIVFYDDASRASDLQAAELLGLLVRYRAQIDFVAVDRGADAARTRGAEELAGRYLDQVPTVVLLDAERRTRLYKTGTLSADELERALDACLGGALPEKEPAGTAAKPPQNGAEAGAAEPNDPFSVPGTDPGSDPGQDTPAARGGIKFTPPAGYSAKQHAQRLKASPGDVRVPGYPSGIVISNPARAVLTTGVKPVVVLFYDDSSKASDLQAAEFLPTLVQRRGEVDFVMIDVSTRARWDDDQKKVVRTYYNFYVPTTVVLAPNRAPVKSWYSRTEARSLDLAIDQALGRSEPRR